MRRLLATASCLAALGLVAFAQQNPQNPQNQQNPQNPQNPQSPQQPQPAPQSPGIDRPQDRDARMGSDKTMTAQEAAEMFRTAKHSLSDSIGTAERQSGGKAIAARCCMKTQDELTSMREAKPSPAGQPDVRRGGTPSGSNEQKRDDQGRDISDKSRTATGEKGPVCIVTCLVGDNRLVDLFVCSKTNVVLGERQVDSLASASGTPGAER